MKREFLHIEIIEGMLYVYSNNSPFGGKTLTLKEMDAECEIGMAKEGLHIKIPLKDFKNK